MFAIINLRAETRVMSGNVSFYCSGELCFSCWEQVQTPNVCSLGLLTALEHKGCCRKTLISTLEDRKLPHLSVPVAWLLAFTGNSI